MKLLTLILFSTLAVAQSPRTHLDRLSDALPDAPSVPQPTISDSPRTFFDGKTTWHQLQELPPDPKLKFWRPRPSFKAVFKSPSFWVSEGAAWGAAIADARRNNCRNNAPCGREIYFDAISPMLAITPLHILTARGVSPLLGIIASGYVAFRHGRGAVTRNYP